MTRYRKRIYEKYVSVQTQAQDNWNVDAYHLWANGTARRVKGWLPEDKNASFLDLGSGPGNFLFFLQEAGYANLTGIDISPEQVEQAKHICPQASQWTRDTVTTAHVQADYPILNPHRAL